MKRFISILPVVLLSACSSFYDQAAYGPQDARGTSVIVSEEAHTTTTKRKTVKKTEGTAPAKKESTTQAKANEPAKGSEAPKDAPWAVAIQGKPGFVHLPETPDAPLDVRGLPRGTMAQDPKTGRYFLVP